jgi:membrane protein implicated in regulation of membrane protease activity
MFFYKKTPKHLSKVAHGNLMDRIMQIGIIVCPLISLIVAAYQSPSGPGTDYNTLSLKVFSIMYLLVVIAFAILASIIYQVWRRRRRPILKETGDVPKKRDKYQHPLCGSSFVLGNVVQKPEQQII